MSVRDVLEQPLIAQKIASHLNHEDCIRFACVSKDERFQDALCDFVDEARFALDMHTFYYKWDRADEEYSDLLNHLTDAWTYDNVLHERDTFFADRVIELCIYLRKNWNLAEKSPSFLNAVHAKLNEMSDLLPACQYECNSLIHDFFDV